MREGGCQGAAGVPLGLMPEATRLAAASPPSWAARVAPPVIIRLHAQGVREPAPRPPSSSSPSLSPIVIVLLNLTLLELSTLTVLELTEEGRSAAERPSAVLDGFFSDLIAFADLAWTCSHGDAAATASLSISYAPWLHPRAGRNDLVGVVVSRARAMPHLAAAHRAWSRAGATTAAASRRVPGGSTLGVMRRPLFATALVLLMRALLAPAPHTPCSTRV